MNKEHTKLKKLAVRTPEERQAAEQKRTTAVMGALKAVHSATSPDSMEPEDLERQRKGQELLGRLIAPMVGLSWEPFDLEGMPAAWVRPERGHDKHRVVLYCHGGGYRNILHRHPHSRRRICNDTVQRHRNFRKKSRNPKHNSFAK